MATPVSARHESDREVYDSGGTWEQRRKLVASETEGPSNDQAVEDVFKYLDVVRAYYRELGRESIDGRGMKLIANVHFGHKYMNAFWDGDEITLGDGDGKIFDSFSRSLDVVAHEMAHGVTEFTAGLVYEGQSGALNEHMSDVFGSAIQQFHDKTDADSADWLIGDEIMGTEMYGEALRSMRAPGTAYDNGVLGRDPQPAHMKDVYVGTDDHGGVHINSGIPNRAFYLTAAAIGTKAAARIWYQALLNLWPRATFKDAVGVITESARRMVRDRENVPRDSTQVIRTAFAAVGLYP